LAIMNGTTINSGVQVALSYPGAQSFKYIPRSGITGLYGSSIFSFLRYLHTDFHSGYSNLHFYQQCRSVTFSPHPHQHFFVGVIILTWVRWNLSVVLICISFMDKDVEHSFFLSSSSSFFFFFW
jgi:hypothetical protein